MSNNWVIKIDLQNRVIKSSYKTKLQNRVIKTDLQNRVAKSSYKIKLKNRVTNKIELQNRVTKPSYKTELQNRVSNSKIIFQSKNPRVTNSEFIFFCNFIY